MLAGVEQHPVLAALLYNFSAALGTGNTDVVQNGFGIFTGGIMLTRVKRAVFSGSDDNMSAAQITDHVGRLEFFFRFGDVHRSVRIQRLGIAAPQSPPKCQ